MMVLPLVFVPFVAQLPGRPRPLLGDDEPLDGRPGARHAAAGPEAPPPPTQKRSSRTPAKAEREHDGAQPEAEAPTPKPRRPPASRAA